MLHLNIECRIFINQRGRIVYVNKRCVEDMGYSREEFYAPDFDFMSLIAPESIDLIRTNFKRHMTGEDIEPYEYSLINKKGQKIESIITTKLINYNRSQAILGIVTDITARKRAEKELQYRLKFQHLVTKVSSQFINLDPDQIDAEINHTLQQIGEFADADRSYVFQFSEDQKSVSCTHEWCADKIEPIIDRFQNARVDAAPWAAKKILNAEMVQIPRVSGEVVAEDSSFGGDFQVDSFFDIEYQIDFHDSARQSSVRLEAPADDIRLTDSSVGGDFTVDSFFDIEYQIDSPSSGPVPGNAVVETPSFSGTTCQISPR